MAATDPVRQIRSEQFDHPVLTDLNGTMQRLAALEPSTGTPYLTAALDWRPEGSSPSVRGAVIEARQAVEQAIAEQEKRSAALESLNTDLEAATARIQETLDPSAQGVFIVANSGLGVLEVEPLGVPVTTSVQLGPIPALKMLAQLVEDYPLHAILQADQELALLTFVSEDLVPASLTITSSLYPRKQASGGWNQRRYQARADERVQAFAKTIAGEVQLALEEAGARRLILSASEVMHPALMDAFHPTVKEKIIGEIRIDIDLPFAGVLEKARPVGYAFERQREAEQVQELLDALHGSNLGVAGTIDVLNALRNGQVSRVLMNRDYHDDGWMDYTMQVFGLGAPPSAHPAGGDTANIVEVSMEEEIIRQAAFGGAEIEIIKGALPVDPDAPVPAAGSDVPRAESALKMDELGGVAAMLRFAL
jgi:hypothetical protein